MNDELLESARALVQRIERLRAEKCVDVGLWSDVWVRLREAVDAEDRIKESRAEVYPGWNTDLMWITQPRR